MNGAAADSDGNSVNSLDLSSAPLRKRGELLMSLQPAKESGVIAPSPTTNHGSLVAAAAAVGVGPLSTTSKLSIKLPKSPAPGAYSGIEQQASRFPKPVPSHKPPSPQPGSDPMPRFSQPEPSQIPLSPQPGSDAMPRFSQPEPFQKPRSPQPGSGKMQCLSRSVSSHIPLSPQPGSPQHGLAKRVALDTEPDCS